MAIAEQESQSVANADALKIMGETYIILQAAPDDPFPIILNAFKARAELLGRDRFSSSLEWIKAHLPEFHVLVGAADYGLAVGDPAFAAGFAEAAFAINSADTYLGRLLDRSRRASIGVDSSERIFSGFCPKPFEHFETGLDGSVYLCCSGWLPKSIGNINENNWSDIWNSDAAQAVRRSIHDRSYRFCNSVTCPVLAGGALVEADGLTDPDLRRIAIEQDEILEAGPRNINLSHDGTCNLACPTCRTTKYVAKGEERKQLSALSDVLVPLLDETDSFVSMTGSGDPFASQHFRHLIKHMKRRPTPTLDLQTNGQLLDEKAWRDLELEGKVRNVQISMDASTQETYGVVRRFGNFDRLMRNLDFISKLRAEDRISNFRLDFVVQSTNYRDIPGFIRIGQHLDVDRIYFNGLMNWGTFTSDEFKSQIILSPDHPEFDQLLEVLRDPVLSWERVWLGVLSEVVQHARQQVTLAA